ncbi:TetR/AcrR family transcriptional regulator [Microlunatus antarcticus]|uniref:AcrR family transcriptional regulator n=1 Tax=Microlunatus antarcticus TaxID=53388 RepID=A0A7W5JWY6_9ACTN|nr:AcrR family transcriptional regulator [Microlunatus antarcticus]
MRTTSGTAATAAPTGAERAASTRERILDAAERLFAERGLDNVSHRQIAAAAGQGNVSAVNYHFGTTADLVRAIVRRHGELVEALRARWVDEALVSDELRAWVSCLIHPVAEHLESLGSPTWWARFTALVATDPRYRELIATELEQSDGLSRTASALARLAARLPEPVRLERGEMTRLLAVHVFAQRETALADGTPVARATWRGSADGIVDATVGLWQAEVTG